MAKLCYPYSWLSTKARKVAYLLETGELFSSRETVLNTFKQKATQLSRAVFAPEKVLKKVDLSPIGGGLNFSGCTLYAHVQELQKHERGFLFSKSSIVRAARELETEAKKINDFGLVHKEEESERVEYKNLGKFIVEDLRAHGLEQKALTVGVEIGASSDGADFSRARGHTSTGYRILDIDAKKPGTNEFLYRDGYDANSRMKLKNYHTSDVVRFVCMSQCKETKDYYGKDINHIFVFLRDAHTNGIRHEGKTYLVNVCFPADMSCHWKLTGLGGACKVSKYFCYLCGCTSQNCAKYKTGILRCSRCVENNEDQCFHYKIDDDAEIQRKKERVRILKEKYRFLNGFEAKPDSEKSRFYQFKFDPSDLNRHTSPMHIDFVGNNRQQKLDFSAAITAELTLRQLVSIGMMSDRLTCLRDALYAQKEYTDNIAVIERYENSRGKRLVPIEWCICCVMHLHNRVVEKMLGLVLQKGFSLRPTREEKNMLVCTIELTMNTYILGSRHNRTNWKLPLNDNKSDVLASSISLTDMQSKKIMDCIQPLLSDIFDESVPNWEEQFQEWNELIQSFKTLNHMLHSRVVFDQNMIKEFKNSCDSFFRRWVRLNGYQGITNYTHIIGAHLGEIVERFSNFYKYSQQGWEHQNKKASSHYHHHSQKGGHGAKDEERSQILPVFRFMARVWMWTTGLGDKHFENKKK